MTKQPNHHVTFSPEALKAVLDQAVAEALAKHDAKPKRTIAANGNGKAPKVTDDTDAAVAKAFKRAGYGEVTPRVDVQTYNRWLAEGRKVKAGEKSIKIRMFRLFHKLQTEPFSPSTSVVELKPKKAKKAPAAAPVEPELPMGA